MDAGPNAHGAAYRGRLAPSPTGLLHIGHACTFWTAYRRSVEHGGTLIFRNEDLDPQRSKPEFARAMMEDLQWLGIRWQEGPDVGGPFAPYEQSRRREFYLAAWRKLRDGGFIYPCDCSRKDLARRRPRPMKAMTSRSIRDAAGKRSTRAGDYEAPAGVNWRFRVPDGEAIAFRRSAARTTELRGRQRLRRLRNLAARRRTRLSAGGCG